MKNTKEKDKTPAQTVATTETAVKTTEATETPKHVRKVKMNAEKYENFKYERTTRSLGEETEDKPRLVHEPRGKKESVGYYGARRLAFSLTKKEYKTPQANIELVAGAINKMLPKDAQLTEKMHYSARDFAFKFFPKATNDAVLIDLRRDWTADQIKNAFTSNR